MRLPTYLACISNARARLYVALGLKADSLPSTIMFFQTRFAQSVVYQRLSVPITALHSGDPIAASLPFVPIVPNENKQGQ